MATGYNGSKDKGWMIYILARVASDIPKSRKSQYTVNDIFRTNQDLTCHHSLRFLDCINACLEA